MLDLRQIVFADFQKNHQGRNYDLDFAHNVFDEYIEKELPRFTTESVMIIYNDNAGVLEFHCINGGTGKDLSTAINQFLTNCSNDYDRAVTYYDNPRINDLIKFSKFPASVEKIDKGDDRTFQMSFDLRGS
jgi:hypothetical protein